MTNDFLHLSRIGKRSSCECLIYGCPENLEGIAKKSKLCGLPNLKGNMLAVRRLQNALQRTSIVGSEHPDEVGNHKKLLHSRRSLQSLLNAIPRVHYPDGGISPSVGPLQFSEQYYTEARNENKPSTFSRSRYLKHVQNTVGSNGSKYCKDGLVKKDRETLARALNGGPSFFAREIHGRKILRRIQQWNSSVYIDIAKTLASQSEISTEPCAYSKFEGVRTLNVSVRKRGFPMSARTNKPRISPSTMRGSKMPASLRKIKVWRSYNGRLRRAGYAPQTPSKTGTKSSLTPFKSAGFKQLYPLSLRRSQIRFRLPLSEGRRSDRLLPASVLQLSHRRAPWWDKREKAAVVLQAQWRMFSARHSYQNVRRASLTIQRQWRETKYLSSSTNSTLDIMKNGTSIVRFMKSNICSQTNGPQNLSAAKSAAATQSRDNQGSLKMPELSVELLYDSNISATQEDEIFDEFLSFLPCPEFSSADILTTSTGTGSEYWLPQSHSVLLEETSLETPYSPNLTKSSSTVLGAAEDNTLQCSPSTKPWNYDIYTLDSPACSPVKELTFARISIDGSLPPTPIKEWSSRQRDLMKRSSAVQIVRDHNNTLDVVELYQSPTKDWASPLTRGRNPSVVLLGSPHSELSRERFQLPNEWFMDLDELDIPEGCWDTSKVTSISFSPPSDAHLKSLYGFTAVPFIDNEMKVPSSRAMICIPEEAARSVSPICESRHCSVIANSAVVEKSPISVKLNSDSSLKTIDLSSWRDTAFSDEDVDGSTNVPTEATNSRLDSSLSPALEEELLDELTKLFHGSPDPPDFFLDISNSPASPLSSTNDMHCSGSLRPSHPKALSRVCSGTLGKDGFSGNSARKLNFNIEDEDGLRCGKGNQGVCESNNQEACDHGGGLQVPVKNMERMLVEDGKNSSVLSVLSKFTLSESVICSSQVSDETLDGNDQKNFGICEMLDDLKASRDSRSYSKRCQSTVTDFLQLVEKNLGTGASAADSSLDECVERCVDRSPRGSSSLPHSPKPLLPSFEDEDDFCDKAVDGNIVVVKDSSYQVRGLRTDPFRASIGWEAASATEASKEVFGPLTESAALDASLTSNTSAFVTPKMQRSCTVVTRSCGAISKTKPPLPMKSRRISFDQINYKSNELFIPADDQRPLLPEQKVGERLLNTSPISPDPTSALCTAPLGYQERSTALSVSKKYFLQSPSSRVQLGKCDSDTESVVSPASSQSVNKESSLEGVEEMASAKHARALFTCQESALPKTTENRILKSASLPSWNDVPHFSCIEDNYADVLKHRASHRLRFPGGLSGPLLLASEAESDCSFRKSTSSAWDCGLMTLMTDSGFTSIENSSPSLHDLCKAWEEESMDLLTRSLKYKSLMTDPDLLREEVASEKIEPSSPQTMAWEIQNIERSKEKLESRERLRELIRQQRNTIYINIATNASMRERYRLYSKWGIRRMSRARLRKVIYELLWNDPKRYHASADLVLQYL